MPKFILTGIVTLKSRYFKSCKIQNPCGSNYLYVADKSIGYLHILKVVHDFLLNQYVTF